jgi:hypothetical protein
MISKLCYNTVIEVFCHQTHSDSKRDQWGDPDVDGRIILKWVFRKWEEVVETEWSWLRIGAGGVHL